MTLVRETGSEIIAQFTVPTRGTWKNIAAHTVPLDAVHDSLNVFVREGKLRNRPGMVLFQPDTFFQNAPTTKSRHIIGGAMGVTPTRKHVFATSPDRLFIYDDVSNTWLTVLPATGQVLADTELDVVDTAFIETSSTYAALFANATYPLKVWTPGAANVENVTGTNIPNAKSICIAASRVIALIPPHTVVWSQTLDYTTFSALAVVKRAQTTDVGICVRSLSALSFVLYKEYSIHPARAQAGLDEGTAFSFYEPIIAEGPAGIYAITDLNGSHIYMTKSGRIAIFDGTSYPTWIADGIWFYLQRDINQAFAYLIRAVYDYRLNIVVFFYPRVNEPPDLNGMVIVNLPFSGFQGETGIIPYCFLGNTDINITHVLSKRFDDEIDNAMLFEKPTTFGVSQAYTLSEGVSTDADIIYQCMFQTGLQAMPDARHTQMSVENFLERSKGYGAVTIEPVVSDSLETPSGIIPDLESQIINLEETPINEYLGFNEKKRFFGLRYTWTSDNTVRYSGTVLYSSMTNRVR